MNNPTDTATQLHAIATHIARHNLDTCRVWHYSDGISVQAFRETNLRSWLDTLTNVRITAYAYDRDKLMVEAHGNAEKLPVQVDYVCVAENEFGLYAALAAQIGDSNKPVKVTLPSAVDAETAVA